MIDLLFPVRGQTLPTDHSYLLYSALSRIVPDFHEPTNHVRFAPIAGENGEKGMIQIGEGSTLRVRLPSDKIGLVLPLVGKKLALGEHPVRLREPRIVQLQPVPLLMARVVTFKNALDPEAFLKLTRLRLDRMQIAGEIGIPLILSGERAGQPRRRVVRIKGKCVVGYSLQVNGLTADESIRLQEEGLGGRTRIGCGFFLPWRQS